MPHGPGADRVEREPRPLPVAATAHLLELAEDPGFVFVLPVPDPLDQPLAAQVVPGLASPRSASRRSTTACVAMPAWSVPGIQRRLEALHPLLADEDVLERVVQGVAQVQGAGHVGRRDDDAYTACGPAWARYGNSPCSSQNAIPALLGGGVIVLLGQLTTIGSWTSCSFFDLLQSSDRRSHRRSRIERSAAGDEILRLVA